MARTEPVASVSRTSCQSIPVVFSTTAQPIRRIPSGVSTARQAVRQSGAFCR